MEILFGSFNAHKAQEMLALLGGGWQLRWCGELEGLQEVDETGADLVANAILKAEAYAAATGLPCFADDTGLEVEALEGAPGVYSARYAGPAADAAANMARLLAELENHANRKARFRTVVALAVSGQPTRWVDGVLTGHIAAAPRGSGGFGYDPVFVPEGDCRTLAELLPEEKNRISHRARAMARLPELLAHLVG